MIKRHIAFFTPMGNGHVFPVLPICSELLRRGYQVSYATTAHYAKRIRDSGAEPVLFKDSPIAPHWDEALKRSLGLQPNDPEWWSIMAAFYLYQQRLLTADLLTQTLGFYDRNIPTLVLYDNAFLAARVIAKRFDTAIAQCSPHFAQYRKHATRTGGLCRNPPELLGISSELDSFLAEHGIGGSGHLWHTERMNIHLIPRAFQYHGESFDDRYLFACTIPDRTVKRDWVDNSNGYPIILISDLSGTQNVWTGSNSYFHHCIDALSQSAFHCILSGGDSVSLRSLPRNFEINRSAAHLEILAHAALSICHGGMSSTLESIYSGVPVLAIPVSPQTAEVSFRMSELGLGRELARHSLTSEVVRNTVIEMMEDSTLLERVTSMRSTFRSAGATEMVCNRIERFLATL